MTEKELEVMCVGQFFGMCPNCAKDTNPDHYPNNTHCEGYTPITVRYFTAIEREE